MFNKVQNHLSRKGIYNYNASRQNRTGIKNRNHVLKGAPMRNLVGKSMVKNTKRNSNWGKTSIGVHLH